MKETLYYPSKIKKGIKNVDEIYGILLPLVYHLNKGKSIDPNSLEHNELKNLLKRLDK